MIKSLTKTQEAKIPEYLAEGLKYGLSTERLEYTKVQKNMHWIYETFLKEYSPKPFVFLVDSPLQAGIAAIILNDFFNKNFLLGSQLRSQLSSQLDSELNSQLSSQLTSQLDSQLASQLASQLYSQLTLQLDPQLYSQLYSQLGLQLSSQLGSQLDSQLDSQLSPQLDSQLYSQLGLQLGLQLYSQLDSQLGLQLDSQLRSQLHSQLYSQLDSQLGLQLDSQLDLQLDSQLRSQLYSQLGYKVSFRYWWSGYYTFYSFINRELLPEIEVPLLEKMKEFCYDIPSGYFHTGFCVISQPPTEIHRKGMVLHNEKDMACKFADGWGLYSLNGIRLDGKYVTTPSCELSVEDVMKESNVDVRREVLRKIGLERFIKETQAKCLDKLEIKVNNKQCEYQLLEVDFGEGIIARVLKMDNPSIDAMHVEGVEDTCNTVKEALAWRNGFNEYVAPKQLT
jgi:hypothetical protein